MNNLSAFSEVSEPFAELQFNLDRDMGMTIAFPLLEMRTDLGNGEVIDAAHPLTGNPKRKREVKDGGLLIRKILTWPSLRWPCGLMLLLGSGQLLPSP